MSAPLWALFFAAAAALPLRAAPDKLAPWTTALRDQQPADAFAAVYKVGGKHLLFVAAKHSNRADSLTFRLINDAYAHFAFDTVIAEGFPTSRGPNPASTLKYAADNGPRTDGFVEAGELFPTITGAQAEKAAVWGGEADALAVKDRVLASGIAPADLLGFYVLRNIPQWIRETKIDHAGDPRLRPLVSEALARNRTALGLPETALADYAAWAAWYEKLNGRPIGAAFVTEEVGPLAHGKFATNRVAYAVSRARAAHLHDLIVTHLNRRESVLVVFGASHLMIHRPALDAVLGRPCYAGADMKQAVAECS